MNVQQGTGTRANPGCPAAGKTGTTDNFNDAWFDGFTPRLAAAVWVGYPDALREMRSVHGISVAGGTFPAEIWGKFVKVVKGGFCGDFPLPKSQIQWSPFFSKYSGQGRGSSYNYDYGVPTQGGYATPAPVPTPAPAPAPQPAAPNGGGNGHHGGGNGKGGGGTGGAQGR
jgi:penicillin-binding protein 1A